MDLARQEEFRLGVAVVRPAARTVAWPGGERMLEPRVMQVLVALAGDAGEVVPRDVLVARCWQRVAVSDDAVSRVVAQLRRLGSEIGPEGFRVETITKVGFRLTAADTPGSVPAAVPASPRIGRRALITGGAAAAVAAGGAGLWAWTRHPAEQPMTVAVMPFEALPAGGAVMARGLARELRGRLARVKGLRVIADASSFALADAKLPPRAVGRRLGADLLVQGGLRAAGDALKIDVELVDPATAGVLWSHSFQTTSRDVFAVQDDVAQAVADALGDRRAAARAVLKRMRRRDPEAAAKTAEAQQLIETTRALRMTGGDAAGLDAADRAWRLATESLEIDPEQPAALVVLAGLVRNGWTRALAAQPLSQAQRAYASLDYIKRALKIDADDPDALAALGDYYRRFEWRWQDAEALLRRALAIDPNNVEARWSLAYLLGVEGRGIEGLAQAQALFALDPETAYRRLALPRLMYIAGDRAGCFRRYDIELAADPANLFLLRELYLVRLTERDPAALRELARRMREDLWARHPQTPAQAALLARVEAAADALSGNPARLIATTDADVARFDGATATQQGRASVDLLYIYAVEYGWAGATGKAIAMLARALAALSIYWPSTLPYGPVEFPKPMRDDPRYAALWRGDVRLLELVRDRERSVRGGQMEGFTPDGRKVRPKLV